MPLNLNTNVMKIAQKWATWKWNNPTRNNDIKVDSQRENHA